MTTSISRLLATLSMLPALSVLGVPSASAAEARVVSESAGPAQQVDVTVFSPSMNRNIGLKVLRPANTSVPAPTLYLLNGAGGGEDAANWLDRTDAARFFADKHVNVVIPNEGAFSYYTDWLRPDAGLAETLNNNGTNMWATFLTKELPPVLDAAFGTNGINALAGISMAATSVLNLAIEAPNLYRSVAAYSGCAMTSDPAGQSMVKLVVDMGGGDVENMWGPLGGDGWRAHDPYLNAARLPNVPMYISSGTGLPGAHDTLADPTLENLDDKDKLLQSQLILGGGIEATVDYCTANLAQRTNQLGRTNITYNFRPTGTHSWGYWEDDLHQSWPMLAKALGI